MCIRDRLRGRGLDGVKLIVGDKCMGMLEAVGEVFPDAKYQRCTVHFYRNVFSVVDVYKRQPYHNTNLSAVSAYHWSIQ